MTTVKQFNHFEEELENILMLRTSPIAVKMLKKKADIPAPIFIRKCSKNGDWKTIR
jgi:uncharacterized protein (DUF169 family)